MRKSSGLSQGRSQGSNYWPWRGGVATDWQLVASRIVTRACGILQACLSADRAGSPACERNRAEAGSTASANSGWPVTGQKNDLQRVRTVDDCLQGNLPMATCCQSQSCGVAEGDWAHIQTETTYRGWELPVAGRKEIFQISDLFEVWKFRGRRMRLGTNKWTSGGGGHRRRFIYGSKYI